ncbi:RNA polymerase sigma factor [Microbacterium allomyrinae]|uniref:RNA polymerase sigma factor n=1 Tax=Microbacterium allomyrinae TaxID=2830666 RepID=UPI001E5CD0D3|nr:sigma factor-like helix-turn-helix DNA-binding protein [Microbacterium allomyrinae]
MVAVISLSSTDLLAFFEYRVGRDDAPDLLAETMTTAWRRASALPAEPVQARMWLFGIAKFVLANSERSGRRRLRLASKLRDLTRSTAGTASAADEGIEVRDALRRLSPDHAELLRLVHWDGLTIAEAAQVCGIPDSTARSRYGAAKRQLRAILDSCPTRQAGE